MTQFSINDPSPSGQEHLFDNYDDDNNDDNDDVNDNDDDDNLRKLCVKVSAIDPPVPQSAWTYLLISPTISNPLPPICQFSNTSQSSWKISSTFLHSVMPFHKLYFACWVLFHVKQQNYSLIWPEARRGSCGEYSPMERPHLSAVAKRGIWIYIGEYRQKYLKYFNIILNIEHWIKQILAISVAKRGIVIYSDSCVVLF